ncbi:MAG: gamma-glutamyl-gamma-aminobutyrate hydrolase family protein [Nostocoides sp.]
MQSRTPIVGVSCYVEPVDRAPWMAQRSAVLPVDYVRHVMAAGGVPVLLPPTGQNGDPLALAAASVLERLDALILAGGADIESTRYGADPDRRAQEARADRDDWELALAAGAVARDLPVLGICRGMQVLAVADGGSLVQHLPDLVGHDDHSPEVGVFRTHRVSIVADTRLASILGDEVVDVPTYHHQAVLASSLAGSTWRAAAWHTDGTLEAMEDRSGRFRLAVQWHPEAGSDPRLFHALVSAAGEH